MRIARFTQDGRTRLGLVVADGVVDLARGDRGPADIDALLAQGPESVDALRVHAQASPDLALDAVRLETPVPRPSKVLAIGLNYADHIAESGMPRPQHQLWFNKQIDCVCGPSDTIELPAVATERVDYEAELVVVIGRRCRHVPAERAAEVILGYTCGNDVSTRDWQMRSQTMTLGKSFPTHGPIGPWIVTPEAFGDPQDAAIRCRVNGELRQHSSTAEMIFSVAEQIAHLSAAFPLNPGDLLFTGTPHGVGGAMDPPAFLRAGDQVSVEIDGIGALTNTVGLETLRTRID